MTALITGVAGQDGVYLARRLLAQGTAVVGTVVPGSGPTPMAPYLNGVVLVEHDVRDADGFRALLDEHSPDEVYNLAGFTSVGASWDHAELVEATNGRAVVDMLEALVPRGVRFFQASSSEELGPARTSPYGRAKAQAHSAVVRAREEGHFACTAILYNHESPLRGRQFVTRKITRAAAEISLGAAECLTLGNLDVSRDWGHARDYVDAMVRMLRREEPEDFVVATGVSHTLQELLVTAFAAVGIDDPWQYVEHDPALIRPVDAASAVGDPTRASTTLGWSATTTFEETVHEMVAVDVRRVQRGVEEDLSYLAST